MHYILFFCFCYTALSLTVSNSESRLPFISEKLYEDYKARLFYQLEQERGYDKTLFQRVDADLGASRALIKNHLFNHAFNLSEDPKWTTWGDIFNDGYSQEEKSSLVRLALLMNGGGGGGGSRGSYSDERKPWVNPFEQRIIDNIASHISRAGMVSAVTIVSILTEGFKTYEGKTYSHDLDDNGNLVFHQFVDAVYFHEDSFPLRVKLEGHADDTFKSALNKAIELWNRAYHSYLVKYKKVLTWQGVRLQAFYSNWTSTMGLKHFRGGIPSWQKHPKLFIRSSHNPHVVVREIPITESSTVLGQCYEEDGVFRLLNKQIKVDQGKITQKQISGRDRFIYITNVIMHELGHALGIKHFTETRGQFMHAQIPGKNGYYAISDEVFEKFLWIYLIEDGADPMEVQFPSRWKERLRTSLREQVK